MHFLLLVVIALLVAWALESVGMTAALAVVLIRARRDDRTQGRATDEANGGEVEDAEVEGADVAGADVAGAELDHSTVHGDDDEARAVGRRKAAVAGRRPDVTATVRHGRRGDDAAHVEEIEES